MRSTGMPYKEILSGNSSQKGTPVSKHYRSTADIFNELQIDSSKTLGQE